jgi:EAL domain-containing protein (putative c-di-GMP-specific phosphodiesterase class I)
VPPSEFIALAEETGLIVPLGQWVLREACFQVATWQQRFPGTEALHVSVNFSGRQFQQATLVDDIGGVLAECRLPPRCLTLEVTETAALLDVSGTLATMRDLKALGVRLAIDDFGAGYAGLGYLRHCPVEALKIDRSYVAGLGRNPVDAAMVRALVEFARPLGIEVTAEGIETADQLAAFRSLGCELGQGFYFARPLPADELAGLLRESIAARPLAAAAD